MAFDSYWLHEPYTLWRLEGLRLFLEHTLRHHADDVYFVRLVDIINWMKKPVGLAQMKQNHLADIASRSHCDEHVDETDERQCVNGEEVPMSKMNMTGAASGGLLMLFDAVSEPLFRSNIVLYSSLSFVLFIVVAFIYDRCFTS